MGRRAVLLVLTAAIVLAVALGLGAWSFRRFTAPGPLAASRTEVIPHGAGLGAIADRLEEAGVIDHPLIFSLGTILLGRSRDLRAGEFAFPARASARAVLDILVDGEPVQRRLTVAEGLTVAQVLALVLAAEGLEGAPVPVPEEGTLLPETYYYTYGDSRAALLARMRDQMTAALAALWPARTAGLPFDSPAEAVILASIVEKETARDDERGRIAAVFINRLRRGMRLDADPTVVYGLSGGSGSLGRPLSQADLAHDTPYNTYLHVGLPLGPIANPGRAALAAVLRPLASRDLYFVADGSGGHAFAATLAEHNRNVAKWRRARRNLATGAQPLGAPP